jgi:ABC-2 type transport system permease protein
VVGLHAADDGVLAAALTEEIEAVEGIDVRPYDDPEELTSAVERGTAIVGVFLPEGMDETAALGDQVTIESITRPDGGGTQLQAIVGSAVGRVMAPVTAAQFAVDKADTDFDTALETAIGLEDETPGVTVSTTAVGEALFPSTLGRFDLGASSQLILFTFLTALAGSSALILTRQLGISRRMLSTPTSTSTIILGEGSGRWAVAMVQGLYIIAVTFLMFRVDWGDPIGAAAILILFGAVGAGAGMLMGATFSNDAQAAGFGVMISLGLAALGGCMFPIELFSPTMQKVAHLTPHAWALDGFAELVRREGTIVDILPELGVLLAFAVVLITLATWRLRVVLTRS